MTTKYIRYTFLAFSLGILSSWALSAKDHDTPVVAELVEFDEDPLDRSLNGGVVSYADSLNRITPAVVSVSSKKIVDLSRYTQDPLWRFFGGGMPPQNRELEGLGSGVIVSKNGYVLTNNHVVDGADTVSIVLNDGSKYEAEVVGTDPLTDIAVLKVDADDLPYATITDSDGIEIGDVVFAIGNPLGVGQSATMGIVSAKGRNNLNRIDVGYQDFIQTDASINQGNSGGALVDAHGRLIGINTLIITDGRTTGNIGIGFAVPSNLAYFVMSSLVEEGKVTRGFLGVGIQPVDNDLAEYYGLDRPYGALVLTISPDSPADRAGLRQEDVIIRVDGEEVSSDRDLSLKIAGKKPGADVELDIMRNGKPKTLYATLVEKDSGPTVAGSTNRGEFIEGVKAQALNSELRKQFELDDEMEGIVVTEVSPDSPYAGRIPVGMVIEKVNGDRISSVSEAKDNLKEGRNVFFVYNRGIYRILAIIVE